MTLDTTPQVPPEILAAMKDQTECSVKDHSAKQAVLLVFLRHFGCTFCRETLQDIARSRQTLEEGGTQVILVHTVKEPAPEKLLRKYGLLDLPRISDPAGTYYEAFGLERGRFGQLFNPTVAWRGLTTLLRGTGIGKPHGDPFRMPGVFLVTQGRVVSGFRHDHIANRPDYLDLAGGDP